MENNQAREFLTTIRSLWEEQKKREVMYLDALKKDSMGSFRRILSQGHVSAVLFQKEIQWMYDYFKCFLTDKELEKAGPKSLMAIKVPEGGCEKEEIAKCLKRAEATTMNIYKSLRVYLDRDTEILRIVDEHLSRITEFYEALSKLERGSLTSKPSLQAAA